MRTHIPEVRLKADTTLLLTALVLTVAASAAAQEATTLTAMQDELKRSMSGLRIEGQPAPYYIAYQVDEMSNRRVLARLGEVADDTSTRVRTLRVEVRVGDYDFDSSRFVSIDRGAGLIGGDAVMTAPLDDDYDVMRRQIWVLSDAAYKRAVNLFAKKKAAFQNRSAGEAIPDFSRETPVERILPLAAAPAQAAGEWIERARQISGVFLSAPNIQSSEVAVIEERGRRYYVNSEGFRTVTPMGVAALRVVADTQTEDGAVVRDFFEVIERNLQDLPPVADLVARARAFATRLTSVRAAKVGDDFTGPVLLEGAAGAELVAQTLAPALLALRGPEADNPALARSAQGMTSPFLSRIGSRVMADGLSVVDTPSLTQFGGRPVPGAYVLDDEGVAGKDVTLVDNGRLMTLLTGRIPQRSLTQSTGHGRGGAVQPGVLQVTSTSATAAPELKKAYLELLKTQSRPFGYIVRSLANPQSLLGSSPDISEVIALMSGLSGGPGAAPAGPLILQIVKVTPDGAEEVVRGMRFGAVTPNVFRDVLGVSEERVLHNYRATPSIPPVPGSLGGGLATVSVIAPALILDDLEIQRVRDTSQKPPVVPSPLVR
jgi:hypothetical protein